MLVLFFFKYTVKCGTDARCHPFSLPAARLESRSSREDEDQEAREDGRNPETEEVEVKGEKARWQETEGHGSGMAMKFRFLKRVLVFILGIRR